MRYLRLLKNEDRRLVIEQVGQRDFVADTSVRDISVAVAVAVVVTLLMAPRLCCSLDLSLGLNVSDWNWTSWRSLL